MIFNQCYYKISKILALAGIWTRDLPGTKSICYQLSYPGLDSVEQMIYHKGFVK